MGPEVAPEILDRVVHRIHRVGLALQAASNGTRAAGEGIEQALDELDCALRDIGAVAFVASAPPDDRTSGDGRQPGSAVR